MNHLGPKSVGTNLFSFCRTKTQWNIQIERKQILQNNGNSNNNNNTNVDSKFVEEDCGTYLGGCIIVEIKDKRKLNDMSSSVCTGVKIKNAL